MGDADARDDGEPDGVDGEEAKEGERRRAKRGQSDGA
jgi:hypothetical protein